MYFQEDGYPQFPARSLGLHKFLEIHADVAEQGHTGTEFGGFTGKDSVPVTAVSAESYHFPIAGSEGEAVAIAQARKSFPASPEADGDFSFTSKAAHIQHGADLFAHRLGRIHR